MDTSNFGNMFYVHFKKISFIFLLFIGFQLFAQDNKHYDWRKFNLGFTMGMNYSMVRMDYADLENNPRRPGLKDIVVKPIPGINLGMISNLRIVDMLDLRFIPSVSLQQRNFNYKLNKDSTFLRRLEAAYLDLPLLIKFKSQFWRNHRVYVMGGGKFSWNLSSDKKVKDDPDILKTDKYDHSVVVAFGVDIYGDRVKLSPEISYAFGLPNIYNAENTSYGNNILRIRTHMLLFSLNFE